MVISMMNTTKQHPWVKLNKQRLRRPINYVLPILLVLVCAALYGPTRHFSFSGVDDEQHLVVNPSFAQPQHENLARIWTKPYFNLYIPVTYSFWWLLRFGAQAPDAAPQPQVFHLANTVVHSANAYLVLRLLMVLGTPVGAAFAGAALFALHPLQVEAVSWISGMKDLLSSFWLLVALILARAALAATERVGRLWLAPLAYALAVLAKPGVVIGPVLLLLLSLSHLQRREVRRRLFYQLTVWGVIAVCGIQLASWAQPPVTMPFVLSNAQRLLVAAFSFNFYLAKLIWPVNLSVDYNLPPDIMIQSLHQAWYAIAILAIAGGLLIAAWVYHQSLGLGILIFFTCLLPTLGIVPYYFQPISNVADRYAYMAMLGPALALSSFPVSQRTQFAAGIAYFLLLGGLAVVSTQQIQVWRNPISLFSHALTIRPQSWFAHFNLGSNLIKTGDLVTGRTHLESTIRLRPWFPDAHYNLGILSAMEGRREEAMRHIQEAKRLDAQTDKNVYREDALD